MSGYADFSKSNLPEAPGRFLKKPFDLDQLTLKVREVLDSPPLE